MHSVKHDTYTNPGKLTADTNSRHKQQTQTIHTSHTHSTVKDYLSCIDISKWENQSHLVISSLTTSWSSEC